MIKIGIIDHAMWAKGEMIVKTNFRAKLGLKQAQLGGKNFFHYFESHKGLDILIFDSNMQ